MRTLYDWFATVLHVDRGSRNSQSAPETMAGADEGDSMNIDTEREVVDYGDSSLDLPEPSEEPAHVGADTQSTPVQVSGEDGQGVLSQGTAQPLSQAAGNQVNAPSASHSPGFYARAARSGAQFDEIRREQAAARIDRQNLDRTLQAVLARMSQVEARPSIANPFARAPKLGTLPKYCGKVDTNELQDWLMQVQAQCSLQLGEEPGPFWVHMAASHLEGPALSHYNNVRAQRAAQGMPDLSEWEEFMAVIKGGFEQYDPEDRAREALDQLWQGNRPVELHQRAFRQYLSKLKSYQLPGQEVCRLFRKSLNPELQEKVAFYENGKRYDDIDNMILMAVRKDTAKRESHREQVGGSAAGGAAGACSIRGGYSSSRGRGSNGRRGGRSFSPPASSQDGAARQVTKATGGEWHMVNGKRKNKGTTQQSGGGTRQQRRRGNHQGTISESFGLTSRMIRPGAGAPPQLATNAAQRTTSLATAPTRISEKRATILIDNGASRNFIARKFMHRHNIVPDSEEVAEVLLANGRRIYTQGSVYIVINVQDYSSPEIYCC